MTALRLAFVAVLFCLTTVAIAEDSDSPFRTPKEILKELQKMADKDPAFAAKYATPEAVFAEFTKAAKKDSAEEALSFYLPGLWIKLMKEVHGVDYESDYAAYLTLDKDFQGMKKMAKATLLDDGVPEKVKGEKNAMKYSYISEGTPGTQLFVKRGKLWLLAD